MPDMQMLEEEKTGKISALIKVGKLLAEQRQKLGMSLEECSDILKLPPSKIEAMERGVASDSMPELFLRGYIKSYSKLLQLSPDEVLEYYESQHEVLPDAGEEPLLVDKSGSSGRWWLPYFVGLAIILLWFLLSDVLKINNNVVSTSLPITPSTSSPSIEQPLQPESLVIQRQAIGTEVNELESISSDKQVESMIDEGRDEEKYPVVQELQENSDIEVSLEAPALDVLIAEEEKIDITDAPIDNETKKVTDVVNETVEENVQSSDIFDQAEAGRTVSSIETDEDSLYFTFSEECWVQVIDANGQVMVSSLRQAGTDLSIVGAAPFSIVLGNVNGVSVYYKGQQIPVKAGPDGRTTRLQLGQKAAE